MNEFSITENIQEILKNNSELFRERAAAYGSNYLWFGAVMKALFPNGIRTKSEEEYVILGLIVQIVSKLTRYSHIIDYRNAGLSDRGPDATDTLRDLSVYSAMLCGVEKELKDENSDI